jgi:hypothetical protein
VSTCLDNLWTSTYLDRVTDLDFLTEAMSSTDPAVGLSSVRTLQRLQDRLEAIHVANAREHGWSWQAIADALNVTRQGIHQKYNRRS